jgi:plastocyanin
MRSIQLAVIPIGLLATIVAVPGVAPAQCGSHYEGSGYAPNVSRYYYSPPTYRSYDSPSPAHAYREPNAQPYLTGKPTYSTARPTTVVSVGAYDNRFEPRTIQVQPGTTVRWVNQGRHAHTITSDNRSWDSGDLRPGQVYSATFKLPGTYTYYCRHHTGDRMEGTIVVGEAATRTARRDDGAARDSGNSRARPADLRGNRPTNGASKSPGY